MNQSKVNVQDKETAIIVSRLMMVKDSEFKLAKFVI
jgi:hypothetical protein